MDVSLVRRVAAMFCVLALATAVAAGCGEDGGSSDGAGSAASSGGLLDYAPKDTIFYATVDLDFDGDAWGKAKEHAQQFEGYEKQRDEMLKELSGGSDEKLTYEQDFKPWLGESAVVAISMPEGDGKSKTAEAGGDEAGTDTEPNVVIVAQVKDKAKAEDFLKAREGKKGKTSGDFTYWEDTKVSEDEAATDDAGLIALSDEVLIGAETEAEIKDAIDAKDGDNVLDNEGTEDVAGEIEGEALVAGVVVGGSVRAALKEASKEDAEAFKQLMDIDQVKAFEGMAFGVTAEDDGFKLHGFAGFDDSKLTDKIPTGEFEPTLLQDLPGNTALALTGTNLGEALKQVADAVTEQSKEAAEGKSQIEALAGVTVEDLAKAYGGQYVLAVGDKADGGPVPPITLITENEDDSKAKSVTEKLIGLTQLAGAAPKDVKAGDVDVKEANLGGVNIAAATHEKHSFFSTDSKIIGSFGEGDTLGDADSFQDAWEAADAPDKVTGAFFADVQALYGLAGTLGAGDALKGADTEPLGSWVGWANTEEDSVTFDLFMQIKETEAK